MKVAVAGATGRVGKHVVDALRASGHEAVPMSRSTGVDVISGEGLDEALAGAGAIVDAATGPSPEQQAATDFFVTAARNLQDAGQRAGVERIVVVSIIGTNRYTAGYGAAKIVHEETTLAGPIAAHVLRASQFHEFVSLLIDWGRSDGVSRVPEMRTQLIAAKSVGEKLAELATAADFEAGAISEIAGPREESLVEVAKLLVARHGEDLRIEGVVNPDDPDRELNTNGALLPGPNATLAGPTFAEWLDAEYPGDGASGQ
jgi:uncharacterized protein YbjT (DUF2867 family)